MTANEALNVIKSWLGYSESDGRYRKIIDIYNTQNPLPRGYKVKYDDQWCATCISAIGVYLNDTETIKSECSCYYMIEKYKASGLFIKDRFRVPKPGDIIFYDWQSDGIPDHVGIVEKCDGNIIVIIEGNYSDSVRQRSLQVGNTQIFGYATPQYTENISNWAVEYWDKAKAKNICDGTRPKDFATREEIITLLGRCGLLD